jgi:hypothetical protein
VNGARLTYYVNDVYVGQGDYSCSQGWQFATSSSLLPCATNVFKVVAQPLKSGSMIELCSQWTTQSKSAAELGSSCNKCYIGGTWYGSGAISPSNPCWKCDPSISKTQWSSNPTGYSNTSGYCNFSGIAGGPENGVCSTTSPKVGMPCTESKQCWKSCPGTVYAD